MTDTRRQIERTLIDIKLAINESLVADEDPNVREAIGDICAHVSREIDRLMLEAGAGLSRVDIFMRLEALRREIDRRFELH